MNKMLKIAALLVAFTTVAAFSQEGGMKFGARGGFNMYKFSTGSSGGDDDIGMGMGFGAGAVASIPLSNVLKVQAEAAFYYRSLYSNEYEEDLGVMKITYEESLNEFAISVPVMVQFYPMDNLWVGAGVQLDLPLSSEMSMEVSGGMAGMSADEDFDHRSTIDFGIPIGLGYQISPEMAVDFRFVLGLTAVSDISGDKSSYMSFGLGFTYFL